MDPQRAGHDALQIFDGARRRNLGDCDVSKVLEVLMSANWGGGYVCRRVLEG